MTTEESKAETLREVRDLVDELIDEYGEETVAHTEHDGVVVSNVLARYDQRNHAVVFY